MSGSPWSKNLARRLARAAREQKQPPGEPADALHEVLRLLIGMRFGKAETNKVLDRFGEAYESEIRKMIAEVGAANESELFNRMMEITLGVGEMVAKASAYRIGALISDQASDFAERTVTELMRHAVEEGFRDGREEKRRLLAMLKGEDTGTKGEHAG